MRTSNLCFLVQDDKVLLAMKKRGFGEGKWNGYGGKVQEPETMEQAAVREIFEEGTVKVAEKDLEPMGLLTFYFNENPSWDIQAYLFVIRRWQGEPIETQEMRPQWFEQNHLPFEQMWVDDPHWLPEVLKGKKVNGIFYFNNDGSKLEKFEIK